MQPDSDKHPPVNHVFVDFENVKTIDASLIGGKNLTFHLFLGPQNKKLDVDVVEKLLNNAQTVELIRSPMAGKNALDFVLAYHLGQAVQSDPKGFFHIISKDGGFDSLIELLKSRHVKAKRHDHWENLSFGQPPGPPAAQAAAPPPKALSASAAKVLDNLLKAAKNRPKRKKTLVSHALSSLGKDATPEKGELVVEELRKAGHLAIDEKGAVSYAL